MPPLSDADKIAAWDLVQTTLNELVPQWNDPSEGEREPGEAARVALRRLYNAAEWDALGTTRMHLQNELVILRSLLVHKGLPPDLERGLTAHLQRLTRLA